MHTTGNWNSLVSQTSSRFSICTFPSTAINFRVWIMFRRVRLKWDMFLLFDQSLRGKGVRSHHCQSQTLFTGLLLFYMEVAIREVLIEYTLSAGRRRKFVGCYLKIPAKIDKVRTTTWIRRLLLEVATGELICTIRIRGRCCETGDSLAWRVDLMETSGNDWGHRWVVSIDACALEEQVLIGGWVENWFFCGGLAYLYEVDARKWPQEVLLWEV